jgi:hypothetical protein
VIQVPVQSVLVEQVLVILVQVIQDPAEQELVLDLADNF